METTSTSDFKSPMKTKSPLAVDQSVRSAHESHSPIVETFSQIKHKTAEAYDSSIQLVRKNPVKSLAIALGVGVAAGYFLRQRR